MRGSDNNSNRNSKGGSNNRGSNVSPYSQNSNSRNRRRTNNRSSNNNNSNKSAGTGNSGSTSSRSKNKKLRAAKAAKTAYDTHKDANDPNEPLSKKLTNTGVLLLFTWVPYIDLDLFSLPIVYHLFSPVSGLVVGLGDKMYGLTDIPVLSFITKRFALTFWLFQPIADVDHVGVHYIAEKGLTKLFARYSDNIADIALGIATAGTVPVALNFVTFFMDSSFWRIMRQWNLDKKLMDHGPHFMASAVMFATATFLGENHSSSKGNKNRNSNKGKALVADGGRVMDKDQSSRQQSSGSPSTQFKPIQQEKDKGFLAGIAGALMFWKSSDSSNRGTHSSRASDIGNRGSTQDMNRGRGRRDRRRRRRRDDDPGTKSKILWGGLKIVGVFLIIGGLLAALTIGASALGVNIPGAESGPLAYLNMVPDAVDNNAAGAAAAEQTQETISVYQKARARVFCLMSGPECLRKWRMNNTQRPGSREVGQRYGLDVENFQAGQGTQIDVAYKQPDYAFPVSFTISNPRRGLKGIDATNVSYRIRMVEGVDQLDDPACDTGYIAIHNAYDIDEDGKQDDIFPGTAASTNFVRIDQEFKDQYPDHFYNQSGDLLTLEDCGMLQPGLGDSLTAVIDVKYDYFSQATLYFRAMSRENFNGRSNIQIDNKESVTADTPAKAAVNVNEPVLYSQQDLQSQPFNLRATLNTDEGDVRYKVKDMMLINSNSLKQVDGALCDFADSNNGVIDPGENMRLLSSLNPARVYAPGYVGTVNPNSPAANMIAGADEDRREDYYWFDSSRTAPMMGCTMELENPSEISPSGETLTVGIKSNYTVAKRDRLGSLRLQNNACRTLECPLLVTLQKDDSISDYDFKNRCTGLDAGAQGCSIIDFSSLDDDGTNSWGRVQTQQFMANQGGRNGKPTDTYLETNDVAIDLSQIGASNYEGTGFAGVPYNMWRRVDEDLDGEVDSTPDENYTITQFKDNEGRWEVDMEQRCLDITSSAREGFRVVLNMGPGCGGTGGIASTSQNSGSNSGGGSKCSGLGGQCSLFGEQQCKSSVFCNWN